MRWIGMLSAVVLVGHLVMSLAFVGACRVGLVDPAIVLAERDFTNMDQFRRFLPVGLIIAPIFEELVYRSLAVPALAAWLGNGWAIFLSGPLFYFLHVVIYGRSWILFHYALAGWILAWAFIRCNKVWTPMILHSRAMYWREPDRRCCCLLPVSWVGCWERISDSLFNAYSNKTET